MLIVKSPGTAVPPLSFTTCLITVRLAGWSSLVIVHVFDWPRASVTWWFSAPQSPENVAPYPAGPPDSLIVYVPALTVFVVPASAPGKLNGVGPAAPTVKSDADAVPPLLFTTCLTTVRCAGW